MKNETIKHLDYNNSSSFTKALTLILTFMMIEDPRYENLLSPNALLNHSRLDNIKRLTAVTLDLKDHQWKEKESPGKFSN